MSGGSAPATVTHAAKEDKVDDKKGKTDTNDNIRNVKSNKNYIRRPFNPNANRSNKMRQMRNKTDEERRLAWEEEQSKKPVLEKGVKGRVKWYSVRYHYGFISRDDQENDVFVHQTAIAKSRIIKYYLRTLADGEEVVFDIVEGKQGPEAANVTGPNGTEVRGSRYHNLQFFTFRRYVTNNYDRIRYENNRYRYVNRYDGALGKANGRSEGDVEESKRPPNERRRRFRNFRARRQPAAVKKPSDGTVGGAGDLKKDSDKDAVSSSSNARHLNGTSADSSGNEAGNKGKKDSAGGTAAVPKKSD